MTDLVTADEKLQTLQQDLLSAAQHYGNTGGFDGAEDIHNLMSDLAGQVAGCVEAMQETLREAGIDRCLHAKEQVMHVRGHLTAEE